MMQRDSRPFPQPERSLAETGPTWREYGAIAASIFLILFLYGVTPPCYTSGTPWEGSDDHGQICSEGQAEQESSEGTEPSTTSHLGFQPRYQNR